MSTHLVDPAPAHLAPASLPTVNRSTSPELRDLAPDVGDRAQHGRRATSTSTTPGRRGTR